MSSKFPDTTLPIHLGLGPGVAGAMQGSESCLQTAACDGAGDRAGDQSGDLALGKPPLPTTAPHQPMRKHVLLSLYVGRLLQTGTLNCIVIEVRREELLM